MSVFCWLLVWGLIAAVVFFLYQTWVGKSDCTPHNEYFSRLNRHLRDKEPGFPSLLVDLDRVDHNVAMVKKHLGDTSRVRVAAKSLPCPNLIEYLMNALGTQRIMAFHSPFALQCLRRFPDADILIGKPFPAAVFEDFLDRLTPEEQNELSRIQWLIDTKERLGEYLKVAESRALKLNISIEVDIGLHRGGAADIPSFDDMLFVLAKHPEHLLLSGLMGYDAHIAKAPAFPAGGDAARLKEKMRVARRYRRFVSHIQNKWPALWRDDLCLNGAGSYTYQMNTPEDWGGYNDITIGSGFVKGTDFDLPVLADHKPALFIATRVLKKLEGVSIPYLEKLAPALKALGGSKRTSLFIYGGWWMARTCSPLGLNISSLYGRSTNQEMLVGKGDHGLEVNDYIFLRPSQSEFVMLQFGAVRMMKNQVVIDEWPIFEQYPAE